MGRFEMIDLAVCYAVCRHNVAFLSRGLVDKENIGDLRNRIQPGGVPGGVSRRRRNTA
jgi:hypothetical protein